MGSGNGNDFLNSDFPMYAAAGVCLFGAYRAFVVSYSSFFVDILGTAVDCFHHTYSIGCCSLRFGRLSSLNELKA